MGAVVAGRRTSDGRSVAVKFVSTAATNLQHDDLVLRFKREMAIAKQVAHPYLVKLLDGGVVPGRDELYMVMELLEGRTLGAALVEGAVDGELCRLVARHQAEALSYLHARGILHRDMKPSNVFLTEDGRAVLLDFGLSYAADMTRLSSTGERPGTLTTMAPEQLRGGELTPATDVYGLGATLYTAATGGYPFSHEQMLAMAVGVDPAPPRPVVELRPGFPGDLAAVIDRCLALRPEHRYRSADELAGALEGRSVTVGTTTTAVSAATVPPRPSPAAREPGRPLLAVVALVAAGVLVVGLIVRSRGPSPASSSLSSSSSPSSLSSMQQAEVRLTALRDGLHRDRAPDGTTAAEVGRLVRAAGLARRLPADPATADDVLGLFYLARWRTRRGSCEGALACYLALIERHGFFALPSLDDEVLDEMAAVAKTCSRGGALAARLLRAYEAETDGDLKARLASEAAVGLRAKYYDLSKGEREARADELWAAVRLVEPVVFEVRSPDVLQRAATVALGTLDVIGSPEAKDAAVRVATEVARRPEAFDAPRKLLGHAGRNLLRTRRDGVVPRSVYVQRAGRFLELAAAGGAASTAERQEAARARCFLARALSLDGDRAGADEVMAAVSPDELDDDDRSDYFECAGAILEDRNDWESARAVYERGLVDLPLEGQRAGMHRRLERVAQLRLFIDDGRK